jgi:hypothetical protein
LWADSPLAGTFDSSSTFTVPAQTVTNPDGSSAVLSFPGGVQVDVSGVPPQTVTETTTVTGPTTTETVTGPTTTETTPGPTTTVTVTTPASTPPPSTNALPTDPALLTNEYAYWNPSAPAVRSSVWELTSGSLFDQQGWGWTGTIDSCTPNMQSTNCTDSAVFRATTKQATYQNVTVRFDLVNNSLTSTSATPAVAWDGVHVFLRYQSQYNLYYASVNRRDGNVIIKKKCVGGSDNGGTYYELGSYHAGYPIPFGAVQKIAVSIVTNANGSVTITITRDGTLVDTATDTGVGCPVITAAGKTGIRGDNDNFRFNNFTVTSS